MDFPFSNCSHGLSAPRRFTQLVHKFVLVPTTISDLYKLFLSKLVHFPVSFITGRYERRYLPVVGKIQLVQPHAAQHMLRYLFSLLCLHQDYTMLKVQNFSQQNFPQGSQS